MKVQGGAQTVHFQYDATMQSKQKRIFHQNLQKFLKNKDYLSLFIIW